MNKRPVALAFTGASGASYGLRLLDCLLRAQEKVYVMISGPAQIVINTETDVRVFSNPTQTQHSLSERYHAAPGQLRVFGKEEWMAPPASGSGVPRALVICPCSSGTLAAIACGNSRNLIERAADVVLKEQKKLILLHRETPLSPIQLENMLRLARAGAVVMPANPGFYARPQRIEDLIDFIVARILEHLDIEHDLLAPWGSDDME